MRWFSLVALLLPLLGEALFVVGGVTRQSGSRQQVSLPTSRRSSGGRLASRLDASALELEASPPKSAWPANDALDRRILVLAVPAVLNFAILPLVGAVDTLFVGRMKEALALAGQSASNQVFSSVFWIISFLPSVVTPLVAKAVGSGDKEAVQVRLLRLLHFLRVYASW